MNDKNATIKLHDDAEKPPAVSTDGMLKHLVVSLIATITLAIIVCGIYPLIVWALSQALFHNKANGSLIESPDGKSVVASRLIGQGFSDAKYFHPRPSANSYDPTSSGGSNLGPMSKQLFNGATQPTTLPNPKPGGDPLPGPAAVKFDGIQLRIVHYAVENPKVISIVPGDGSVPLKNFQDKDRNYDDVKLINAFNDGSLSVKATTANGGRLIPADAVTASGSGLDPHISLENADIQAQRVADARSTAGRVVDVADVKKLIADNTDGRDLWILGEPGVNVITLNLALDKQYPVASPTTSPAAK